MNPSPRDRVKAAPATAGRLVRELLRELVPKVLFFFVAFMMIFMLLKLFVAQYSIEYFAFTRAAVAALILGKVIPLLDWADSGYRFETHRRIAVIAGKTVVYALVVMALAVGEEIVKALYKEGSLRVALSSAIAHANGDRFIGLVLLISLVVGGYLTLQEIDRALGKGTLLRVLVERPADRKGAKP